MPTSRVAELKAVAAALAAANTTTDAVAALFDRVLQCVGAASGALWLADVASGTLRWAGGAGIEAAVPEAFQAIPIDADIPGPQVMRTGQVLTYSSVAERDQRWPALAGTPTRVQAVAVLPVEAHDSRLGVLGIGFADERQFDAAEIVFLGAVADQLAFALERSKLMAAEREARSLLEFLADTSRVLSSTLEPDGVLRELCRLTVPKLGEWAALYVPRGGQLVRVEQVIDGRPDLAGRLIGRFPVDPGAETPVAAAFRTGELQRVPAVTREMVIAAHPDPEFAEVVSLLALRTGLAVPVASAPGGPAAAVMTLCFTSDDRTYTPQLVTVIEEVAARAGVALDTASRYQRERRTATILTHAVLPTLDGVFNGFEVGARYLPVDVDAGDVGGDWFDAFELADGRVVIGIGDVAGHGVEAATTMAMLRHGARAVALDDPDPGRILAKLNRLLMLDAAGPDLATALYAVIDPTTETVVWASAGHPPLITATPDAAVVAPSGADVALGVDPERPFTTHEATVPSGAMVVLATDGVIETKDAGLDVGLKRLAEAASQFSAHPAMNEVCDLVLRSCVGDRTRGDDCCVVAVRRWSGGRSS